MRCGAAGHRQVPTNTAPNAPSSGNCHRKYKDVVVVVQGGATDGGDDGDDDTRHNDDRHHECSVRNASCVCDGLREGVSGGGGGDPRRWPSGDRSPDDRSSCLRRTRQRRRPNDKHVTFDGVVFVDGDDSGHRRSGGDGTADGKDRSPGGPAAMPKGSTAGSDGPPSVDRTKTGCFGCMSRKNAKSTADDQAMVTKSAFVHYGSTDDRSAIDKRANRNRKPETEQQLVGDICHATKSAKKNVASRTENEAPKNKQPSGQNHSHHQLLSVSSNSTDANTGNRTSTDAPDQTCNNSTVADTGTTTSTGGGCVAGEVADSITAKCSGNPNNSRTIIQCKGDHQGLCSGSGEANCCAQVSTLDSPRFFAGSGRNKYQGEQECIPCICDNPSSPSPHPQLLIDLRAQNFDAIRFSAFRTACKLRFLQTTTLLHLVDIWNVMTVFHDHGLDMMEPLSELPLAEVVAVISDLYDSLRSRLPSEAQLSVEPCMELLINWLSYAFSGDTNIRLQLLSVQVLLSVLCAGRMSDKLRLCKLSAADIFGQSNNDSEDCMQLFENYLCKLLDLPSTVLEAPTELSDSSTTECIDWCQKFCSSRIKEGRGVISGGVPHCLLWLHILHILPKVENAVHSVPCSMCRCGPIVGFRYRCQQCEDYSLCQRCFWSGLSSEDHTSDHEVKEFAFTDSVARESRKSQYALPSLLALSKSVPVSRTSSVAATSSPGHLQGVNDCCYSKTSSAVCSSGFGNNMSSSSPNTLSHSKRVNEGSRVDDEHRLIARYVRRLASCPNNALLPETSDELGFGVDDAKDRHHLVAELEAKNREILREIQQLRVQQKTNCSDFNSHGGGGGGGGGSGACGPALATELQRLRLRRDELETRMRTLQGSRRELMLQLETLMKLLKNPLTPWSTPAHSPRSKALPSAVGYQHAGSGFHAPNDSTVTVHGGDARSAICHDRPSTSGTTGSGGTIVNYLRKDLVSATDSVTDAVSSLVKELNSEDSSESEGEIFEFYREHEKFHNSPGRRRTKSKELNIIPDIRIHKSSTGSGVGFVDLGESEGFVTADDCEPYNDRLANGGMVQFPFQSSNELYDRDPRELVRQKQFAAEELWLETDQESYIRTDDDDEGGNTDWEDAMKRWINR